MEQQTKANTTAPKTSPQKDLKQHHSTTDASALNGNNQRVVTTSNSSKSLVANMDTLEITYTQQATTLCN